MTERGASTFWPGVVVLLIIAVAAHIPSLRQPHFEGDEVIFTFMAERIRAQPLNYSLRGPLAGPPAQRFIRDTWLPLEQFQAELGGAPPEVLANIRRVYTAQSEAEVLYHPLTYPREYAYDPEVYDRPMFFHPPVYPAALAAARATFGSVGGPLLSMLSHQLLVVTVALLGRAWFGSTVGVVAAALVTLDPVSLMSGSRLWIDGPLQALVAAALLTAWWALTRGGVGRAAIAGLALGLACLTKTPAVLLAPAILVAALLAPRRVNGRETATFLGGAAVLIVPWLVLTKIHYGAWLPAAYPTQWLIDHYPYVSVIVNRPWHFYVTGLLLTSPILIFAAFAGLRLPMCRRVLIPAAWAGSMVAALWILGLRGQGYQLRYLAPATPALCLLAAAGIVALCRTRLGLVLSAIPVLLFGAVSGVNAVWSPLQPPQAEPVPIAVAWALEHFGVNLWQALPGMWQ